MTVERTVDSLAAATGQTPQAIADAVFAIAAAAKRRGAPCTEQDALDALGLILAIRAAVEPEQDGL